MSVTIKEGDTIPHGTFKHVPYTLELDNDLACGFPTQLSTQEWKGKKVVIFSVPGAFTPTCHANHLPPYLQHFEDFKAKNIDVIAVVAANDPFVMSGWGRVHGVKDKILTLSDTNAEWSGSFGLAVDLTEKGMGLRTCRYAMVLDDLKVVYLGIEPAPGVTVSGAEAVLLKL